ncbi:cofilin [Pestalotiopsis sp. IQ-011]
MSYEGADLNQMAKDGTRVPEDAAKPNIIPSKAGFHNLQPTAGGLGAAMLSEAADNPVSDEKRLGKHGPGVGEVITGTGDSMPSMTSTKHTGTGGKNRQ